MASSDNGLSGFITQRDRIQQFEPIRKDFRTWKIKQKDLVSRLAQEPMLQDMLKIPTIAGAYEQMKADALKIASQKKRCI